MRVKNHVMFSWYMFRIMKGVFGERPCSTWSNRRNAVYQFMTRVQIKQLYSSFTATMHEICTWNFIPIMLATPIIS